MNSIDQNNKLGKSQSDSSFIIQKVENKLNQFDIEVYSDHSSLESSSSSEEIISPES